MRIKLLVLITIIFLGLNMKSQITEHGIPTFLNISPIEYGQESQNFSVLKDNNHLMYFGNVNGIIEYDNLQWHLIPVPGRPMMDINDNNVIYYGGYNQLGRLVQNENNITVAETFDYHPEINPGQINKVIAFNDYVFYTTATQLLLYYNDSVEVELSNIPDIDIFKANDNLYVFVPERGLFKWKESGVVPIENIELLRDVFISDLHGINDSLLLIKPRHKPGFLIFDGNILEKFNTEVDHFIEKNNYSCSQILKNGNIIIGTTRGGAVCIDKNGEFLYVLNRESGLRENHITDIFIDKNNEIWLTSYNGIALVETPSAFSFFDPTFGLNGAILSVKRFNGDLYVASTSGVYKYNDGNVYDKERFEFINRRRFQKIENLNDLTWQLYIINENLYAISLGGIYLISDKSASLVLEGQYNTLYQSEINPDIFLIGSTQGLLISNYLDHTFDTIGYVKDLNYSIRSVSEEDDGTVWLGTNADGLFKLNFRDNYTTRQRYVNYNKDNAFKEGFNWIDVYPKSFGTVFSTQVGLYNYDEDNDKFVFDESLGYDFDQGGMYLYPIIEDKNMNLWFSCIFSGKYFRETGVALYQGNQQYEKQTEQFSLIQEYPIESIYSDKDNIIWFGSTESLIQYNHNFAYSEVKTAPCLIRSVTIKDSVINILPGSNKSEQQIEMHFSDRTIRFDFTYLKYNTYGENEFQVFLEGFDSDWSEWSSENFKEYTALTEKEYTFRVRARDIYGNVSDEAIITFRVIPPFYRTIYAYVFYVLVFGVLIYLILKLNELRHAKERYRLEKLVKDRTNELAHQKEQTEKLVKKLLPDVAVDEIKQTGKAKSQKFEMVSILFADIQGFTKIAEEINPEDLINHLNKIFSSFDKIIGKYNIQKIKTIGDAYMCAGGMPEADNTNPIEVILAGLEMQNQIQVYNKENNTKINLRVGVHSGSVVAGVVGSNKLEYDIWGDSVNIASRMESHGLVNSVNVSEVTYNHIKDFFHCESRGKISIKYKGELEMFFVDKIKPELAEENNPMLPNKDFFIKLQHIKLKAIQEEILEQLEKNLPKNLYYHNLKHTLNVLFVVENLARKEKVNEEELLLLKCAALFHDAGFMVSYDDNEKIGADMAEQTLRKYKFSQDQIDTIKRLIMATQLPPRPKDLLERIICDADLDYLGRPDFIPISQNLFRELFERGKINTIEQWNKLQYKFMKNHTFFTETARKKREPIKKIVIEELKNLI